MNYKDSMVRLIANRRLKSNRKLYQHYSDLNHILSNRILPYATFLSGDCINECRLKIIKIDIQHPIAKVVKQGYRPEVLYYENWLDVLEGMHAHNDRIFYAFDIPDLNFPDTKPYLYVFVIEQDKNYQELI